MRLSVLTSILFFSVITLAVKGHAKGNEVTVGYQPGLSYLPLIIMKNQSLLEKKAQELGLRNITTSWQMYDAPDPIRDKLVAETLDFGAIGTPSLITLWEKTKETIRIKAVASLAYMPMFLNTSDPYVQNLDDLKEGHIIAMPSAGTSAQSLVLQMAASERYGFEDFTHFDSLMRSMPHTEAQESLLAETPKITAHFASVPFQNYELEKGDGRVRTILNSYDVLGGASTFTLVAASSKLREQQPLIFRAFTEAFDEAVRFINTQKMQAAQIFVKESSIALTSLEVFDLLNDPDVTFNITPRQLFRHAQFMKETGVLQELPNSWITLSHPHLHPLSGS